MKNYNRYLLSIMALMINFCCYAQTDFNFTGDVQIYQVPDTVTTIKFEAWGAQGGDSEGLDTPNQEDGGLGGYASGFLTVTPGDTFRIYVGGKPGQVNGIGADGGYNGGGISGQFGGAGGGATDVRLNGFDLESRIIVAGGGGGGNTGNPDHGTGGAGGGLTGVDGIALESIFTAGTGGSQIAGGIGSGSSGFNGGIATDGELGLGGSGTIDTYHMAGGGGGYYGGGAAQSAGGGGGSSYVGGVFDGITNTGVRTGDGLLRITEVYSYDIGAITKGNATYEYPSPFGTNAAGQTNHFTVNSQDVINQDWWFYRANGDLQEYVFPIPSNAVFNNDTAIIQWFDVNERGLFSAELKQVINQPTTLSATLVNKLTITNISANDLVIDLFKYADFNIDDAENDEASLTSADDHISIIDQVTVNSIDKAQFRASGTSAYQVTSASAANPSNLLPQLTDNSITNLDSTGLPFGPGDFNAAYQWAQVIPEGGTLVIETTFSAGVTTAPEPNTPLIYFDLIYKGGFEAPLP